MQKDRRNETKERTKVSSKMGLHVVGGGGKGGSEWSRSVVTASKGSPDGRGSAAKRRRYVGDCVGHRAYSMPGFPLSQEKRKDIKAKVDYFQGHQPPS